MTDRPETVTMQGFVRVTGGPVDAAVVERLNREMREIRSRATRKEIPVSASDKNRKQRRKELSLARARRRRP